MRVSVLNDAKHPTGASKYWQSVREMSAHFDAMMGLSFDLRRNAVERLRLERKLKEAEEKGEDLDVMEVEIDLDQNLYAKANMEQVAHDRVRELKYAQKEFSIEFTPGLLLLFPSYLHHSVPLNKTEKTRCSLAFNVVPTVGFGEETSLTELKF